MAVMASNPTVSELRKTSDVTDDEITAAVDAVLADLATEAYPLAKGWTLDLAAAVANHKASQDALLTDREAYKRNMVRTAILLAHPVKA
jgi:N-acetylglutamate synthase/N-acetylornithine aminotransferase